LANMPPETIVLPGGKELEFCRFGIAEHPLRSYPKTQLLSNCGKFPETPI